MLQAAPPKLFAEVLALRATDEQVDELEKATRKRFMAMRRRVEMRKDPLDRDAIQ